MIGQSLVFSLEDRIARSARRGEIVITLGTLALHTHAELAGIDLDHIVDEVSDDLLLARGDRTVPTDIAHSKGCFLIYETLFGIIA